MREKKAALRELRGILGRVYGIRHVLGALALCLWTSHGSAAPSADALFKEGLAHLKAGDIEAAAQSMRAAAELERTAPLLFNLAQVEIKRGRLVEAHNLLEEARALSERGRIKSLVDLSIKTLKQLESRVPSLTVAPKNRPRGLRITLNGDEVTPGKTFQNPGEHTLVADAPGYEKVEQTFRLAEGESKYVEFTLERTPTGATSPGPAEPILADTGASPLPIGPLVLGGTGAVALIGGVYFYTRVSSLDGERRDEWAAAGCPGPSCPGVEPESARLLREDAEQAALFGNVLVGVGATMVVGAGVWWWLGKPTNSDVTLSVGPRGGVLRGSF